MPTSQTVGIEGEQLCVIKGPNMLPAVSGNFNIRGHRFLRPSSGLIFDELKLEHATGRW